MGWFRDARVLHRYVAGVSFAGLAVLAGLIAFGAPTKVPSYETLLVLTFFLVFSELMPIKVPRGDDSEAITVSSTFSFALLILFGTATAVIAQAGATLLADVTSHKPWWKSIFNVAQFTLAWAASGLVLTIFSDVPTFGRQALAADDLLAIILSGFVFFAVNNALLGVGLALSLAVPVWRHIRQNLAFQASTAAMMLALSPIVVVAAERTLWLIPLVSLPLAGIYRSGREAIHNEYHALHDSLTGLPNRTLFRERVHQTTLEGERDGSTAAIMIMDLDRFKEINDTLGHHNGDRLLKQIGPRLRDPLRRSDTVARLGGDEFAVLIPSVESSATASSLADEIRRAFRAPFVLEDISLDVEPSIGIAFFPQHGLDVDTLLQRADVAMYVAKERRSGFEIYAADQDPYSAERLALVGELRRAIDEEELVVHYQPKADLRTGRIVGAEALVRWQHPDHGLMPPDAFIPIAEHTGLIRPLTLHILNEALRQYSSWRESGFEINVAVNLSVRSLLDHQLTEDVGRLLRKWNVLPQGLELEITESVLMTDMSRSLASLNALRDMGVTLAVDDFGTGHSSLAYLKRLPVHELKIDKSFVMNMMGSDNDAVIVRSTIDLGRNLGLSVVAEGVESLRVWKRLLELGCSVAQGYFISRPVPGSEITRWLKNNAGRIPVGLAPGDQEVPAPARSAIPTSR
jgi:diguanylate cyclase (GGDEF)-like protein